MSELVERAIALRPAADRAGPGDRAADLLLRRSSTEAFDAAGFYRMLVPRRYGGLEVDLATFLRS